MRSLRQFTLGALILVSVAALPGCFPTCGTYTSRTGLELVVGDATYDYDREDMYEACGADLGSFGEKDLDGAGMGSLVFMPDHKEMEVALHVCPSLYYHLFFSTDSLEVGRELEIMSGEAGIHAIQDVPFVKGTVEVLDAEEPDPECTPFREQQFELSWDLEYHDEENLLRYTTQGQDWLGIGLPSAYGDPGC